MYSQTKKNKAEWIAIGSLLFSILLSIPLTNFLFLYPSSMVCLLGWVFFISVFRASQSAKYVGRPFSQLLLVPFESLRRLTYELLKGEDPVQIKVAAEKFCGFAFLFTGFCLTNNIINESDINGALFSYVLSFLPAGIFACRAAKIMHRPSFVLFLEFFGFKIPKILKCKPPFYLHCRFPLYLLSLQVNQNLSPRTFKTLKHSRECRYSSSSRKKQGTKKSADPDPEGAPRNNCYKSNLDCGTSLAKEEVHHE